MESIRLLRKQGSVGNFVCQGAGKLAVLLALGLIAATGAARAQNTGSVLGSVVDKTGAVVPKATVTIADPQTGAKREAQSNGNGEYLIGSLPVGTYILTVTAPNFEASVITDIKVDANSNVKEVVTLQPGSTSDSVTVQDTQGSVIDPNSATIATMLDPKMIEDLPIDGHNIVALTALLPGVVDVNAPATFTGDTKGPTYSASGSRNTQNLMLFDGLTWNNLFYNTGINYPTPNELQEVSILLNNYKAEYGRNAGSVFNVITKRGTNQIHGSVWDYFQNQALNAADYLSQVNPKDNQNQFGFQIGGPILKDKLFVSGAYQQLIGRLQTTATDIIPGYAERGLSPDGVTPLPCTPTGPFPGMQCASFLKDVTNTAGVPGKFTNPLTITGSSGNQATDQSTINDYTTRRARLLPPATEPGTDLRRQQQLRGHHDQAVDLYAVCGDADTVPQPGDPEVLEHPRHSAYPQPGLELHHHHIALTHGRSSRHGAAGLPDEPAEPVRHSLRSVQVDQHVAVGHQQPVAGRRDL